MTWRAPGHPPTAQFGRFVPLSCGGGEGVVRALDQRLLRHARASRTYLIVCVVLGVVGAGLILTQATLLAAGITTVFRPSPEGTPPPTVDASSLDGLEPLLALLAVVVVARAALAWAQEAAAHRAAAAVRAQLRDRLLAHVANLGPGWLHGQRSAELTLLATRGLDSLDAYFARYLPQLVLAAAVPLAVLAYLFPVEPVAAATMLVTAPLIPIFLALVGWTTRSRHERLYATQARTAHHLLELIRGLPTLKAFGRANHQLSEIRRLGDEQHRSTMRTLRLAFLSSLVLELIATISVALVAVEVGLRLVGGGLELRTALVVLILAPEVYLPLRQLGAQHHASADGLAAADRVLAVLAEPPPSTGDVSPAGGPVVFDKVSVRYPDRTAPALEAFSLRIRPGEVVALTGASGCGKSTALHALLGFVTPAAGRITVGGWDLASLDLAAWRSRIAWLPQRPVLFPGTVAANIRLGDPFASEHRVRLAARDAGVENLLSTVVTHDAGTLSAGERQRVALARAFLRDAPVLLLDEPTANLDRASEDAVVERIAERGRGRTVVVVAHRPALLRLADRVVELTPPMSAASSVQPAREAPDKPAPLGLEEVVEP
jgi:ATP-binding cassette, subfamily C, bacterial CydD